MSSSYVADENLPFVTTSMPETSAAVTLTACMGALPCARGIVGEGGRLLTERRALIGLASLRAVTSHGGEALWCKITSPFMGGGGPCHFQREVRFIPLSLIPQCCFPPRRCSP